ncbi:redoxin domain-containing protein [Modestobacter excelsi]|uniref:redoxin domain-containing protein n=1 Tax=Modestobacter excelsi TaxID=2213161 RepID=UPI001C20E053|nr:redoxin domain-containing protein [Modestobacter excelsi]
MTPDFLYLAANRHGGLLHHDDVRAEDRGAADGAAALWPAEDAFSLDGATAWLNSPPLTGADLRGRVVAVNFWTSTCINWLRQLPHLRAWEAAWGGSGLVVVGVHSPEFAFERDIDNVRRAIQDRCIGYPVAIDDDFAVWRSFHNHFWPALYLVDARGRFRHHTVGEGGYEETETILRELLMEAGAGDLGPEPVPVEARGVEAPADWNSLRSAETYLGYDRTAGFASPGHVAPDQPREYTMPAHLRTGHWALSGTWRIGREASVAEAPGGRLTCRFHARDLHLVVAPPAGKVVRFRLLVDGRPPGADAGIDVACSGDGEIRDPRLHQLVRQHGSVDTRTVDIEFTGPGVGVYAFTFG